MDSNVKVQRYLDDLRRDGNDGEGVGLRTVRGPGQTTNDPLQFVSTRSGDNMAERARMLVTATEQQKRQREERHEKTQSRPIEDENDWQADLDTWRRKRKTKAESSSTATTPTSPQATNYESAVDYGIICKGGTREEILTIRSPEDSHDSGIENRTLSHSPSTSIDFSPRSVELPFPTKSLEVSPPTYTPPPPPLDQVLIPLSAPIVATRQQDGEEQEDYPLPPTHLRKPQDLEAYSSNRARVSASFTAPPTRQPLEPFVAQSLRDHYEPVEKTVTADLTVELNREQKAHVSATKYPGRYGMNRGAEVAAARSTYTPRSFDEKKASVVSTMRHSFETGVPLPQGGRLATSSSTPNVSSQPARPVYRAVEIPFDDSAASYQPPKRDKDGLMTIVVEMAGQPIHKGFGFTVACERRRCFVDSVIVGTPADRQGLLIGDRIEAINGESTENKYPSAINRLLHESVRNGEVVLRVERNHTRTAFGSTPNLAAPAGNKFDQARSVFSEKQNESYAEFKRKHTKAVRERPSPREYNSLPRSSSAGYIGNDYGHSDYRVSSLHDRKSPGKLDDFVPEVERDRNFGYNTLGSRTSHEETRTIRNYELLGANGPSSKVDQSSIQKHVEEVEHDDDTQPGKAYLESRDWRDVINQQRQAAPGRSADTRRIQEATSSLSNLPDIIDKKLEEQRRHVNDQTEFQYARKEPKDSIYERSEYSFYEKKYTPTYEGLKSLSTTERPPTFEHDQRKSHLVEHSYGYAPQKETPVFEREVLKKEAIVREPENVRDQVVSVSGKHRCAHCGEELGRGAAMIVESLHLYYHLSCFKCFVCKTPLGSGDTGADVRVREGRLHCSSCYSSGRIQLSKV